MRLMWLAVIGLVAVPMLVRAECGWLLMTPPLIESRSGKGMGLPNTLAPLTEWTHEASYDTAAACEAGRRAMKRLVGFLKPSERKGLEDAMKKGVVLLHLPEATLINTQYDFARCLPASQVPVR